MTTRYEYEWDVELVQAVETPEKEEGEVLEHYFQTNFTDCVRFAAGGHDADVRCEIVLVVDTVDGERGWAYLQPDGKLPEFFKDAMGGLVCKVPQRFHREVAMEKTPLPAGVLPATAPYEPRNGGPFEPPLPPEAKDWTPAQRAAARKEQGERAASWEGPEGGYAQLRKGTDGTSGGTL